MVSAHGINPLPMSRRLLLSVLASVAMSIGGWIVSCGSNSEPSAEDVSKIESRFGVDPKALPKLDELK